MATDDKKKLVKAKPKPGPYGYGNQQLGPPVSSGGDAMGSPMPGLGDAVGRAFGQAVKLNKQGIPEVEQTPQYGVPGTAPTGAGYGGAQMVAPPPTGPAGPSDPHAQYAAAKKEAFTTGPSALIGSDDTRMMPAAKMALMPMSRESMQLDSAGSGNALTAQEMAKANPWLSGSNTLAGGGSGGGGAMAPGLGTALFRPNPMNGAYDTAGGAYSPPLTAQEMAKANATVAAASPPPPPGPTPYAPGGDTGYGGAPQTVDTALDEEMKKKGYGGAVTQPWTGAQPSPWWKGP